CRVYGAFFFFFFLLRPPPTTTLFPYTTLFLSRWPPCRSPASARARGRCCGRSEEHTSELQSRENLVCRLLLEKKKKKNKEQKLKKKKKKKKKEKKKKRKK